MGVWGLRRPFIFLSCLTFEVLNKIQENLMNNYNDMARALGYDPTDPDHIDQMQDDFATDELIAVGLTEDDLRILQAEGPTSFELVDEDE